MKIPVTRKNLMYPLPTIAHPGDAGADLTACESLTIEPGARALVSTGLAVAIPDGYAGLVLPRSGLAVKYGVTVINAPGLIDSGYRGELRVGLINHGESAFSIAPGDRIAQLVVMSVESPEFIEVEDLDHTPRGADGFGSTGVS